MSEDNSSEVLHSLPSRPLSMAEGEELANREYDEVGIAPLSAMKYRGDTGVFVLMIANGKTNTGHLVGYNPQIQGWERIESFDEKDWSVEKKDTAIDEWARATFGEENIDHSFIEV